MTHWALCLRRPEQWPSKASYPVLQPSCLPFQNNLASITLQIQWDLFQETSTMTMQRFSLQCHHWVAIHVMAISYVLLHWIKKFCVPGDPNMAEESLSQVSWLSSIPFHDWLLLCLKTFAFWSPQVSPPHVSQSAYYFKYNSADSKSFVSFETQKWPWRVLPPSITAKQPVIWRLSPEYKSDCCITPKCKVKNVQNHFF